MSEQENELRSFLVPDGPHYTVAVPEAEYEALCAAEARVRVLEDVIRWLPRSRMACRYCGQFSSASICYACQFSTGNMPRLMEYLTKLQAVLEAAQGPEQQEAG